MSKNKRFKDKKYSSKCLSIELHQKTFYGYFGQFVGLHNTPRAKITKIVIGVTFPIQTGGSVDDQSTEWATLPRWCL